MKASDLKGAEVFVDVIEAKNLIAADAGGTSDPYVEITVPSTDKKKQKAEKTKAIKKNLNPKWNEKFEFHLREEVTELLVQVFDWNRLMASEYLGQCQVPLMVPELAGGKSLDRWFILTRKKTPTDKPAPAGEIHLKVSIRTKDEKKSKSGKHQTPVATSQTAAPATIPKATSDSGKKAGGAGGGGASPPPRLFDFIRELKLHELNHFLTTHSESEIHVRDEYDYTPLQSACTLKPPTPPSQTGDPAKDDAINAKRQAEFDKISQIILRLLEVPKIDVAHAIKTDQNTAMHYFCQNYRLPYKLDEIFTKFKEGGANINARNSNNETPLFKAITNDAIRLALVDKLLELDADVNISNHSHGNTPLHYAVLLQRVDLMTALLEAGADVRVKNKREETPLKLAQAMGDSPQAKEMAHLLQNVEELMNWLASNDLAAYAKNFQKIGMMTREKLLAFKKPHLERMGIKDKDQRHKLQKAIKAYKKAHKPDKDKLKDSKAPDGVKPTSSAAADSSVEAILSKLEGFGLSDRNIALPEHEIEIGKKLGSGAAGDVFRGQFKGQPVAVKVLKEQMAEKELKEFQKELRIISKVKSPYTVYFFGCTLKGTKLCLVMEFCARGSLNDVMKSPDLKLGWKEFFKFALETSLGLECLHSHEPCIVHRDLKSLNLLVTQDMHVKVCDFGLSREDNATNDETLNQLRGTMAFCAPEVYHSSRFTVKSDVFSLTLVLWELLNRVIKGTYEAPYSEHKHLQYDFQIIIQVAKKNLRPTIPPSTPPPLVELLKSGMEGEPDKRPHLKTIIEKLRELEKDYQAEPKKWDATIGASAPAAAAAPAK